MKLRLFKRYIKNEMIDKVFLMHPDSNITYFSQVRPTNAILEISENDACLYLSDLDYFPKINDISVERLKKDWNL